MIASILAFFSGVFEKLVPFIEKYFPPKTALEKENEGQQKNAELINKLKDEGRP